MKERMKVRRREGFTLLELLISLTLLAIIVVLIFGAFRVGIRAWEKGEAHLEDRQRYRIVLNQIQSQLASAYLSDKKDIKGRPLFAGDEKSLAFFSRHSLIPGSHAGVVYAQYRIDAEKGKEVLRYRETDIVLLTEDSGKVPGDDNFTELLSDMKAMGFEYLSVNEEQGERWQSSWNPGADKGFPRAVRMGVRPGEELSSILTAVVPVQRELIDNKKQ
jgi:general secretion pathway protein J